MGTPGLKQVYIGMAGWGNPPAARKARAAADSHLAHYATTFNCVEINSSFYRPHQPATYRRWRDETPAHFRFSVKMPRSVTHEAGLMGTAREVKQFYREITRLRPKLKAVLVQLPGSLEFDAKSVRAFFRMLPPLRGVQIVCEPRHASWFTPRADQTLLGLQVSRVAADPARSTGADAPGGSRRLGYFRWHGSPQMYYSKYEDAQLRTFVAQVRQSGVPEAWCIFDNTARYAAWDDAIRFRRLLEKQGLADPTVLRAAAHLRRSVKARYSPP